jgi:hypothetical protein
MNQFVKKYSRKLVGVISGFDRLVLKGTLRPLSYPAGMMNFLFEKEVLLKDFRSYVEKVSEQLKEASQKEAERLGRTNRYLESSRTRKEPLARKIAEEQGLGEGLICLFRSIEPCMSYDIYRDRQAQRLELVKRQRKCLWIYHYWIDPRWGFMSGRIQTWFPFDIYLCLNGREWLARQMDQAGIQYHRVENCLPWIEDPRKAQRLMDRQLRTRWLAPLQEVARRLNPAHGRIFRGLPIEYYWTVHQNEWATDLMFRSAGELARMYPALVRGAMEHFSSPEVMRFLGKRMHGNFTGEVVSEVCRRLEGICVKHRVKANSVKMYDKGGGHVLRIETTMNDPRGFKVFRPVEGNPGGQQAWRPLTRGIANMNRLAEVGQSSNDRYLDALAALDTDVPISTLVDRVCCAVDWQGRRVRALRPWSEDDRLLLKAISRGEFAVGGLRNRDLLPLLFPQASSLPVGQRRRYSARVTRNLRMLRAHGIIRKVAGTHRYVLTRGGAQTTMAILQYQQVSLAQLERACA